MLYSTIMSHMSEALIESRFRFTQLREIEHTIAWNELVELVEPHYLASDIGRNLVIPTKTMIRIFFLQHCYMMTPTALEDALHHIEEFQEFALIKVDEDLIPSKENIEAFNQLVHKQEELIVKLTKTIPEPSSDCIN